MKLQKLTIANYRNFDNLTLTLEPDCTILIGENNSGKSNIISAIYSSLRANRTVRQGAFEDSDYHLANSNSYPGEAGPISIEATFLEEAPNEWNDEIQGALGNVISIDPTSNIRSITIRVSSIKSDEPKPEEYQWSFLDSPTGQPTSQKHYQELNRLQSLRPLFSLSTLRDADKEFSQRSTLFGAFINNPQFSEEISASILENLSEINDRVLESHTVFGVLKGSLDKGNQVVQSASPFASRIQAVPSRISDLLANTQVTIDSRTGVPLPLDKHGAGTQSLSVLSLFRAYIDAKLLIEIEPLSEPIVTIEEPESHLHPCAARSLWDLLSAIAGQVIVTTHSGDLVGEAPLRCLRRIRTSGKTTTCRKVILAEFDQSELQNLDYYVRMSRGELLFANAWLLVEGKSELLLLQNLARAAKIDLYARGVRIIEHSQHGKVSPFIKLADQLGIFWFSLSDGDTAGQEYAELANSHLDRRPSPEHIATLDADNLEMYLCQHGFSNEYLDVIPAQSRALLTEPVGTDDYFRHLAQLAKGYKTAGIAKVCASIERSPQLLPELLKSVFSRCIVGAS